MIDYKLSPVNFSRRATAFIIDLFIISFIRSICIQVLVLYWLSKYIIDFANGFKFVFGQNVKPSDFSSVHFRYFTQSELFPKFLIFFIFIISIGFIYNLIMLFTKWSATIGQKIVGIFAISRKEKPMKWYHILARSFFAVLPLNAILFLFIYQFLGETGVVKALAPQTFIIIVGVGLLIWYDIFFFTQDKLLMHDVLSSTKIVQKDEFSKGFFEKLFDIMDRLTPDLKKLLSKIGEILKDNKKEKKIQRTKVSKTNKKKRKKK